MIQAIAFLLDLLLQIVSEIVSFVFELIISYVNPPRKTMSNADFMPISSILKKDDAGFSVNGEYSLSPSLSELHQISYGGTGSGKSSCILLPSLLSVSNGRSSIIINDPSGDLFKLSSGALRMREYEIKILNYGSLNSESYNPLARCKSISDIQKLSDLIIRNTLGQKNDPFWTSSASSMLSLLIRLLIFYSDPQYRTLSNVLYLTDLMAGDPTMIDKLIIKTKNAKMLTEYKAFISMGDRTLTSIIATAKSALTLFNDEIISVITSEDTIDFNEFRNKRIALFIQNNVAELKYYGALSSLFFQQSFKEILTRIPEEHENRIFYLLDEASSLFIPEFSNVIANIRKYKCGLSLIFQSYNQLENIYGHSEAKAIVANCATKIYLPGQSPEICTMISQALGKFEYIDDQGMTQSRSLLLPDEVRMTKKAIIFISNEMPIHATLHPFYKNPKLVTMTKLSPYESSRLLSFESSRLIPIDD